MHAIELPATSLHTCCLSSGLKELRRKHHRLAPLSQLFGLERHPGSEERVREFAWKLFQAGGRRPTGCWNMCTIHPRRPDNRIVFLLGAPKTWATVIGSE